MTKYRKKPVLIEAIQFDGTNVQEIWEKFGADGIYGPTETNPDYLILTTVHGDEAPARAGDWVIPDGKPGTFYPCKPDIFAATYDEVTEYPLIGRTYETRDPRERGRRVRIASYDAEKQKYRAVGVGGHGWTTISEKTLTTKWRQVSPANA